MVSGPPGRGSALSEFTTGLERLGQSLPSGLARESERELARAFSPWQSEGISTRMVEEAATLGRDLVRYQVVGGGLYRVESSITRPRDPDHWFHRAVPTFEGVMGRLLHHTSAFGGLPEVDFVVNLGDASQARPRFGRPPLPVLSTWVRRGCFDLPYPSPYLLATEKRVGLNDTAVRPDALFSQEGLDRPWHDRRPIVFWRGSSTGMYDHHFRLARRLPRLGLPIALRKPRLRVCRISRRHPELVDAAISNWTQVGERTVELLRPHVREAEWATHDEIIAHRYLLNVQGNAGTSSFPALMGSGSVLLHQEMPFREFYTHALRPGTHFVPVRRDLKDLVSVARWCREHDLECRAISSEARAFSERYFRGGAVDFWLLALFRNYAAVQRPFGLHPDAVRVGGSPDRHRDVPD